MTQAATFQYAVNLKSGGLLIKEKEILKSGSGSRFELERWYRSRSLFRGFFGQGWCSSLDEKIKLIDTGILELSTCDSPQPVQFTLNSQADVYLSSARPLEKIKPGFGNYTRFEKSQELSQFDFRGELKSLNSNGQKWKIKRNERNLIESLVPEKGFPIIIKWLPQLSIIEEIQSTQGSFDFQYSGFLLKSVGLLKYKYDEYDNLISRFPSSPLFQVKYDIEKDRVLKIDSLCSESYRYESRIEASIKCPHQKIRTAFLPNEGV